VKLRVVIVGIPGVGKSTVVEKVERLLKGSTLVTFGTVMFDEGKRRGWVRHRDEMRKLKVEKQRALQKTAAEAITMMKEKVVLVDTHLFVRTNEGYWPGLPAQVAAAMKPTHLVLVEATPKEVASRRAKDATRYRDAVRTDELEDEMSLARQFLVVASALTGAPMLVVSNVEGKADEAAGAVAMALGGALE
jgi:adenylate kinase